MSQVARYWVGRTDSQVDRSAFRYHQVVNQEKRLTRFVQIIGFECEEGVRRNHGRLGAKEAPNIVRQQLANIPWKLKEVSIEDYGNVVCEQHDLERAQQQLGKAVAQVLRNDGLSIIIGGGHETTYGHYLGVREAIGTQAKLGIINIDAHFDMRPYTKQSSSGTMFLQIKEQDPLVSYCVVGIQPFGNTDQLYHVAQQHDVFIVEADDVTVQNWPNIQQQLDQFFHTNDIVYLTLCTDVLNVAFAPGVSATTPFGIDPIMTKNIIRYVMAQPKVTSFDICEINPRLDIDHRTSKLGAYFINEAIVAYFKHD